MRIVESKVTLQSEHSQREQHISEESLRTWVGESRPNFQDKRSIDSGALNHDQITLSAEAIQKQFSLITKSELTTQPIEESIGEDPRLRTTKLILEALTGRKINISNIEEFKTSSLKEPFSTNAPSEPEEQERVGWGIEYDYVEQHLEQEEMSFSAQGTIVTSGGQQVDFSIELAMQREFIATESITFRAGDALLVDPLVINFDGTAAQLTDTKFAFDLNSDSTTEQISFLKPGSGFLFIDRDDNGKATNGSELFGPQTNDGFQELAKYDLDQNGWIDENDPIFEKLLIWSRDKAGSDYFSSLADKNIGAIYLGQVNSEFSLKGQDNTLHGKIQNSSIYLSNNFKAGSIQEIHLTV